MTLSNDDLQAIATLVQGVVKTEVEPLKEDIKSMKTDISNIKSDIADMQDDITDIKVQLNQVDNNIIKTRQQVLREVKRLNNITDAAFEDIGRIDTKVEKHINNKHTA